MGSPIVVVHYYRERGALAIDVVKLYRGCRIFAKDANLHWLQKFGVTANGKVEKLVNNRLRVRCDYRSFLKTLISNRRNDAGLV